mmetsp:Transcript_73408/g.164353  ORF Transcript_73408/g.164353 Transcript_73408/m.164353 type:complete len:245 (-) Transcript_73408:104-838(-)
MDLPSSHLEIVVPPRSPTLRAVIPLDVVGEDNLVMQINVEDRGRGPLLAHAHQSTRLGGVFPDSLGHAMRLHLKADNSVALKVFLVGVVLQQQLHVVVDIVTTVPLYAHGEAVHVREVAPLCHPCVACGRGEVVDDPIHQVLVVDHASKLVLRLLCQRELAEDLARHVLHHLDVIGRVLYDVPNEDLPEVLHTVLDGLRLAVGQHVVPVRELRLHGRQLVDLQVHLCALRVLNWRDPRQVEGGG